MSPRSWRLLLVALAILVLAGGILAYLDWTDDQADARVPAPAPPLIAGHRGTTIGADENTIAAMKYAHAGGADILETDVQWTSDSKMVIMHDSTLDRTTNCSGKVSGRSLASVKRCATPRGEHPPSLRQLLVWAAATDPSIELFVEIKGERSQAKVSQFVGELAGYDLANVTANSFYASNLAKVEIANDALPDETAGRHLDIALGAKGAPYLPLQQICDRYDGYFSPLDYTKTNLTEYLQETCDPPTWVGVWGGINTDVELEQAYETDARVIVAEDPKRAVEWLASR